MSAYGLAGAFAGIATLVQLAAIVMARSLLWREGRLTLWAVLLGALTLMVLRRALSAFGAGASVHPGALPVLQEGLGLAVSVLVVAGVVLARAEARAGGRNPRNPALQGAGAADLALEDERQLLCYEIHDGLAQLVSAARMHLDTFCWLRVGEGDGSERELSLSRLRLKEASAEVSRIVSWLQLSFSEDLDLSEAVRSYLSELADAEGWQYEFEDRLHPRRASRAVEAMAYRVMQEALNNAAKHAQTRKVKVSLREENGALVATVQDWGRGFDPKEAFQKSRRLGLRGMSTRAHLVGGTCTFDTLPGEGTLVVLRVPGAVSGGNGS